MIFAIWSRVWIGWWAAIPVGAVPCMALAKSACVPGSHKTPQLGCKRHLWRKALATRTVTRSPGIPPSAPVADDFRACWLYPASLGPCVALRMADTPWCDAHRAEKARLGTGR